MLVNIDCAKEQIHATSKTYLICTLPERFSYDSDNKENAEPRRNHGHKIDDCTILAHRSLDDLFRLGI